MHRALREFDDAAVRERVDGLGSPAWRALRIEALLGLGRLDTAEDQAARAAGPDQTGAGMGGAEPYGWRPGSPSCGRMRLPRNRRTSGGWRGGGAAAHACTSSTREIGYGRFLLAQGSGDPPLICSVALTKSFERLRPRPFLRFAMRCCRPLVSRPASRGAPLDFTHQELAVARLVAAGRTNSEVGRELFITSRTVAFHLSNIYAKAGIASRRELAGRFPRPARLIHLSSRSETCQPTGRCCQGQTGIASTRLAAMPSRRRAGEECRWSDCRGVSRGRRPIDRRSSPSRRNPRPLRKHSRSAPGLEALDLSRRADSTPQSPPRTRKGSEPGIRGQ